MLIAFRILIVDDEPPVVDAITTLLEQQSDLQLEIYNAYRGNQAIEIMKEGKIDLLITDINMPDISGLDLLETVSRIWPLCRTLILTGYSDFSYAYNAIKNKAAGYLLKTEDNETIVRTIRTILDDIQTALNLPDLPKEPGIQDEMGRKLLSFIVGSEDISTLRRLHTLELLGFSADDQICVISCFFQKDQSAFVPAHRLLTHYLKGQLIHIASMQDSANSAVWLISLKEMDDCPIDVWLKNTLEIVQNSLRQTFGVKVSFAFCPPLRGQSQRIAQYYRSALMHWETLGGQGGTHVFTLSGDPMVGNDSARNTVRFIYDYIHEHIGENISLLCLANASGYNATYLSKLFHRVTGEALNRYIAKKKLEYIESQMKDSTHSIDEIAKQAGFKNRPYFNRFIKKETGLSPSELRASIQYPSVKDDNV
ncbi:putative transcriptional regulatory protein YesN [Clostridia bacterium]|nr:putative transcriptional regulatory protein YesN [Clostridia bacterium]